MSKEYIDFINKVKKVDGPKVHKIRGSYGTYDAYRYYRKYRPKEKEFVLSYDLFSDIVKDINESLVDEFLKGAEVKFPMMMGSIELRKYIFEPRLDDDGKLIFKAPVDWSRTHKLWFENPEAFKNKILVRFEDYQAYKIHYLRHSAKYKNKTYYRFQIHRAVRQRVFQEVKEGSLDALRVINKKDGS